MEGGLDARCSSDDTKRLKLENGGACGRLRRAIHVSLSGLVLPFECMYGSRRAACWAVGMYICGAIGVRNAGWLGCANFETIEMNAFRDN